MNSSYKCVFDSVCVDGCCVLYTAVILHACLSICVCKWMMYIVYYSIRGNHYCFSTHYEVNIGLHFAWQLSLGKKTLTCNFCVN